MAGKENMSLPDGSKAPSPENEDVRPKFNWKSQAQKRNNKKFRNKPQGVDACDELPSSDMKQEEKDDEENWTLISRKENLFKKKEQQSEGNAPNAHPKSETAKSGMDRINNKIDNKPSGENVDGASTADTFADIADPLKNDVNNFPELGAKEKKTRTAVMPTMPAEEPANRFYVVSMESLVKDGLEKKPGKAQKKADKQSKK